MGIPKSVAFTTEKILALSVRDIEVYDTLELSQPLVSRHLKQMCEAGVLTSEQKGRWVIYSLTATPDTILECWIEEVRKELSSLPTLIKSDMK